MVKSMGRSRVIPALLAWRWRRAVITRRFGRVKRGLLLTVAAVVLTVSGGIYAVRAWSTDGQGGPGVEGNQAEQKVKLVPSAPATIFLPENVVKMLGVSVVEARSGAEPRLLEMQGSLALDTNKLVRVHARFAGEVIEIAAVADDEAPHAKGQQGRRPLSFGDRVKKDQLMAVVWSKDLGEKKSELIDGLSQLRVDQQTLDRLSKAYAEGAIPERTMHDMERNVEAEQIAVARAERTLEAWRLPEAEIEAVRDEARLVHERHGKRDSLKEKNWARVEVRAPFDGVVVEKNLAVGDIIDTTNDLFKVASLSPMTVWANAREEDLPRFGPAAGSADLERADQRRAGNAAAGRPDGPHRLHQRPHAAHGDGHGAHRQPARALSGGTVHHRHGAASARFSGGRGAGRRLGRRRPGERAVRRDRPAAVALPLASRRRGPPDAQRGLRPLGNQAGGGRTGRASRSAPASGSWPPRRSS